MRNLNFSIDSSNLVDCFDLRAETSMDTEGFSVNDGTNRQIVKYFSAVLPGIWVSVFSVDFVIKAINCRNLSG